MWMDASEGPPISRGDSGRPILGDCCQQHDVMLSLNFHRDPAGAQRPRGDEPRPSMTPPAATTGTATASTTVRRVAIRAPGAGSRSVAHDRPRVV